MRRTTKTTAVHAAGQKDTVVFMRRLQPLPGAERKRELGLPRRPALLPKSLLDHVLLLSPVTSTNERHGDSDLLEVRLDVLQGHLHGLVDRSADANLYRIRTAETVDTMRRAR